MKKRFTLIIALTLIFLLALSACGSKKAEETNVLNFPVVDSGGDAEEVVAEPVAGAEPGEVDQTYPIDGTQEANEVMLAYPVDPNSADYDKQMEEYLGKLFGDKHTLDALLAKKLTAEQLYAVLTNEAHMHLKLGPDAIQVIIDWFVSR